MTHYHCGELITKPRIQDESWYCLYSLVAEIFNAGPNPEQELSFYEDLPNGTELALQKCLEEINKIDNKDKEMVTEERLKKWISTFCLNEEEIKHMKRRYL